VVSCTLEDLVVFNAQMASSVYGVCDEDTLETVLSALLSEEEALALELSPRVAGACRELRPLRDLLLLKDLEDLDEWARAAAALSSTARAALLVTLTGLAVSLTDHRPAGLAASVTRIHPSPPFQVPAGRLDMPRAEVVSHLAHFRFVADKVVSSMPGIHPAASRTQAALMHRDIVNIVTSF
jgi:hypothetical protein